MQPNAITDSQIRFFLENGYLILRGGLEDGELEHLRSDMDNLSRSGTQLHDPDYHYASGHSSGKPQLHRVDYVVDKSDACKVLLGHPFVLRATELLMGKDLIPTWDAMVLKLPGEGILVPWHRDASPDCVGDQPIFNVDFYLDEADHDTCVWVVPGSHLWDSARVASWIELHASQDKTREDFELSGAIPAIMQSGDIMLHNILVLHGSPRNSSNKLRRVIYYEFRTAHVEEHLGPHQPCYIPVKQKILQACIARRIAADYVPDSELPYVYDPPAPYDRTRLPPGSELKTYRAPHEDYWRPSAWTPRLSLELKAVSGCRVAPNGKGVVFVTTSYLMKDDTSEQRQQIWLNDTVGGDANALTSFDFSSTNPRWSPDSAYIAFTSSRGDIHGLYVIRVGGGEAVKLCDSKTAVTDLRWSPSGDWIAYLAYDGASEQDEERKKEKDDWRFEDENLKFSRLVIVPVHPDSCGNRDASAISPPDVHVTGLCWSPDSIEIAYEHMPHPKADYWTKSAISRVRLSDGEVTELVSGTRAAFNPHYSRDGKRIAFGLTVDPPRWSFASSIHTISREGGPITALALSFEAGPGILGWVGDDSAVVFSEILGTTIAVYSANSTTGEINPIYVPDGAITEVDLNDSGTYLGYSLQRPDTPAEAYIASIEDLRPVCVSAVNTQLAALPVGKTESVQWNSSDGMEIEGLLTYPVGYREGFRVPLLLVVHGGPSGVFMQTFLANPGVYPLGAFSANGFAVLRVNPRGSSGYGAEFRAANRKDWGGGDYRDLMCGVDRIIEMGVADPDRMGVMGWSYGGYMTSWIITQTSRFRAASVGAGVTNLMSFNGTADIPSFIPDYFEAQSWENLELYVGHSPMFQVRSVTTPTLIVHGEADIRVPISQGYELYNALKQLGVVTRMLVLPRQPHGPTEPRQMLKNMQVNLEWFTERVLNA